MARKKPEGTEDTPKASPILHCRMRPADMEMIDSLVISLDTIDRTSLIRRLVKEAYAKERRKQTREEKS